MSLENARIPQLPSKFTTKPNDKFVIYDRENDTTYGVERDDIKKYFVNLQKYVAKTYYADEVFVLKDNAIYELVTTIRPFTSSDFDAELTLGHWEIKVGQGDDYFDWEREITTSFNIGDIIGGTSLKGGLEKGLFGAVAPLASLSITGSNPREKTGAATVDITLNYTVTRQTNPVTSITVDGEVITPTGNTQSGSIIITIPSNVNKSFTLVASDGEKQSSATVTQNFLSGVRIGATADQTITDADINDITPELRSNRFATRTGINFGGEYALIVYPASYGEATIIINGLPNSAYHKIERVFTNDLAFAENSIIYVSNTTQSGNTSIVLE